MKREKPSERRRDGNRRREGIKGRQRERVCVCEKREKGALVLPKGAPHHGTTPTLPFL